MLIVKNNLFRQLTKADGEPPASYPDVARRLYLLQNVRAKEGGKDCTLPMVPCGSSLVTRVSSSRKTLRLRSRLRGGTRGRVQGVRTPPPRDDEQFSNTTGILQKKKTMWFIGVEVEQETSAPPPEKNPGSAPEAG